MLLASELMLLLWVELLELPASSGGVPGCREGWTLLFVTAVKKHCGVCLSDSGLEFPLQLAAVFSIACFDFVVSLGAALKGHLAFLAPPP